jgi:hypothetical protein
MSQGTVGAQSSVESFDHFMARGGSLGGSFEGFEDPRNSFQVQDRDYSIYSTASLQDMDELEEASSLRDTMLRESMIRDSMLRESMSAQGIRMDELEEEEMNPVNYDSDDSESSELDFV